jgi:uncharacterized repeat protein (TIGR03803 family)
LTTAALVLVILLMAAVVGTKPMKAQTFHLLYSFKPPSGPDLPVAPLIRDSAGDLYGTTAEGGLGGLAYGTVFKLDKTHTLTVLHSFASGNDGNTPTAGLLRDVAGNLYGTTYLGGGTACGGPGCGIVYKIDASGTETVLHSFNRSDGAGPSGNVVRDKSGNLYSTTYYGGSADYGTVFKVDTTGTLTTLYTFTNTGDGYFPNGSVVRDAAGNLYGTCLDGGPSNSGTVYRLDTTGALTVLHAFDGTDGANPYGGLIADAAGNLYGTTVNGGSSNSGTVFRVGETTGAFTLLHSFDGGLVEGSFSYGTLARDSVGDLYGANTTGGGGCKPQGGCGAVWKLDTNNQFKALAYFGKRHRGIRPFGGVLLDRAGNLYGTTSGGGGFCRYCGTVFKITP